VKLAEVVDEKAFSYQKLYGLHVSKVQFRKNLWGKAPGAVRQPPPRIGNFNRVNKDQWEVMSDLKDLGWECVNGWRVGGKEFSSETDNNGTFFEREILIATKPGEKGSVAIFPSGHAEHMMSKAWKPQPADFKK
jgi:hypothetical protein